MLSLAVILMSTAVGMAQMAFDREKEATEFKNEKLNAEMKFLKSQINPHFLFNSLNSAYTLAYIKSDDAPEVILRLSNMLRYLIYECDADKVPVSKEITYIENYIAIQKIRLDNPDNINVSFQIDNSSLMVEPMLFIPFIENSFKHSYIENSEKGWIDILLNVNDKNIEFIVRNSLPEKEFSKDKVGGIGLENVKRRLELLYHKDHKLIVEKREKEFFVQLNISIV
ncbi:MAG: hypothetical protein CMO01_06390 [Thalassobius sp.]|nr:hypothetical protein [Thalassovita sp.]